MSPLPPNQRPLQVLVVDDDTCSITLLDSMLRTLGVRRIETAIGGAAAVTAYDAAKSKPDLVLCDLNMPGVDGFQFIEQLAARGYKGGVVLVSGTSARVRASAELMGRFHRLKVLGTVEKPVRVEHLAEALARA